MGTDQSPYEGLLDGLGGKIALGQVISMDNNSRTVRVKTMGNRAHGTDDQDLPNVKIGHMIWHGDGSYAIAMPVIGSYYIVGFINSEPILLAAYPLSNTDGGGGRDNQENLLPGDMAFVTAAGSRVIIRSGGTVEIEATKNTRTYWLPTNETITTVCENNEMAAAPGFQNWTVDPDTEDTLFSQTVYDNLTVGTVVQTQIGATDSGAVFDLKIGPPDDTLSVTAPTLAVSVQADGTTNIDVGGGKVTFVLTPDGKLTVNTAADANITVGGAATIDVTGDATVKSGGNVNVTAGGNIEAKGSKINLNGAASGVTTANSHMNVIDLITGAPVQPSTTVFADV